MGGKSKSTPFLKVPLYGETVEDAIRDQLSILSNHHEKVYIPNGLPMKIENTTQLEHHYQEGEHATLHSLWEYCHRYPKSLVVYIHFKEEAKSSSSNINDRVRNTTNLTLMLLTHDTCLAFCCS